MQISLKSPSELTRLKGWLSPLYGIPLETLVLLREMIGHVYLGQTVGGSKYIFKLYRPFHRAQAAQSLDILQFLQGEGYPAAKVILTAEGGLFAEITVAGEGCIVAAFDFIQGEVPDIARDIGDIGAQTRRLHDIMAGCPLSLMQRGKAFYIGRFLRLLRKIQYPPSKIAHLAQFGDIIWAAIEQAPHGFCHGDLHTGNMFKTETGDFVLFDFDIASRARPIIDMATLCDATDFNALDERSFETTHARLQTFLQGYGRQLSTTEARGIFYCIAARHYELIATIAEARGRGQIRWEFLDDQYDWLMAWQALCAKNLPAVALN